MPLIQLKGLKGLSAKDAEAFKQSQIDAGIATKYDSDAFFDRLYRNGEFIDRFGEDAFGSMNKDERDALFQSSILEEELSKYNDDPNIGAIRNMTPEGQIHLLENYISPEELNSDLNSGELSDKVKNAVGIVIGDVDNRALINTVGGAAIGSAVGSFIPGVGNLAGFGIGAAIGSISTYANEAYNILFNKNNYKERLQELNSKYLDEELKLDLNRKLDTPEVKEESAAIEDNLREKLRNKEMSYTDIDNAIEQLTAGREVTYTDPETGEESTRTVYGSANYQYFKDNYLKDLNVDEKLKVLADFSAMTDVFGEHDGSSAMDLSFGDLAASRQDFLDKTIITTKRNIIGTINDVAQTPVAITAAGIQLVAGDKAAADFINKGEIAGIDLGYLSPAYWNKAAKYNQWSDAEIAKSEEFGGLSDAQILRDSNESQWDFGYMMWENLGQLHYMTSQLLLAKGVGAGAKVLRISGPKTQLASMVIPSASMSSIMGREAYDATKEELTNQYNEILKQDMEKRLKEEVSKIDWDAAVANYKASNKGDGRSVVASDEEIKEMLRSQFIANKAEELRPIVEAANKDVLNNITTQSLDAFRMESLLDLTKNSLMNAGFRSYMYNNNPALQRALRNRVKFRSDPGYSFEGNTVVPSSKAHKPGVKLFAKTAGKQVIEEGLDEFLDGITTGISSGYNVAQFDEFMKRRENPEAYDETNLIIAGLTGAWTGIKSAYNGDNYYEAVMGAMSPFTPMIAKPTKGWRLPITIGAYEDYVSERDRYADIEKRINNINSFLTKNSSTIGEMGRTIAFDNDVKKAMNTGDLATIEQAKQNQLIHLASIMSEANNSAENATMVEEMNARIDKLIADDYTDEEKQQLGTEVIAQPENQNLGMTAEQGYEALRENAKKLREMSETITKVSRKVDALPGAEDFSNDTRSQLIVLAAQSEDWESTLSKLTSNLGIGRSSSADVNPKAFVDKNDAEKYRDDIGAEVNILTKNHSDLLKKIDKEKAVLSAIKENKTLSVQDKKQKLQDQIEYIAKLEQAESEVKRELNRIKTAKNKADKIVNVWDSNEHNILSSDEILGMGATDILYMIENKDKYSSEQQAQIDEVEKTLVSKDSKFRENLKYASDIERKLDHNKEAYSAIARSPKGYEEYTSRLQRAKIEATLTRQSERFKRAKFAKWDNLSDTEVLNDILTSGIEGDTSSLLHDYIEERKAQGNPRDMTAIEDLLKLQNNLANYLLNPDSYLNIVDDPTGVKRNNVISSINSIITTATLQSEALGALNNVVSDTSVDPVIRENLALALDNFHLLADANSFLIKKSKEEISRREMQREKDEKFEAEARAAAEAEVERLADEAAQANQPSQPTQLTQPAPQDPTQAAPTQEPSSEGSQETRGQGPEKPTESTEVGETMEDYGQEAVEEVDRMPIGREPVEMTPEEDVLLADYDSNSSVVVADNQGEIEKGIVQAEQDGIITGIAASNSTEANANRSNSNFFLGNSLYRYWVTGDHIVHLREDVPNKEGERITGNLLAQLKWFDAANIHYQDVIDNELHAISKLDPEVRVMGVRSSVNATNDSVMRYVHMLVVEYTDEVAKIHKGDDSIVTANGKKWLVIGTLGYAPNNNEVRDNFIKKINDNESPYTRRKLSYFNSNPNESFYVDDQIYTKIASIGPGYLVRGVDIPGREVTSGVQTVSELMRSAGLSLDDAKFGLQKHTGLAVIGRVPDGSVLQLKSPENRVGNVFLLIPANGKYITAYLSPAYTNMLKENSELKNIINNLLTSLVSRDHKERFIAIKKLSQYLYFEGDNNIYIGEEGKNVITIVQEGVAKSYDLDKEQSIASVIGELLKTRFRIQIKPTLFQDPELLSLYDNAGALTIDLRKYGTSGASVSVYNIGDDGKPIIEEVTTINSRTSQRSRSLLVDGIQYTYGDNGWRDYNGTKVTDPTILRKLSYTAEIMAGKSISSSSKTHNWYVFNSDREHPVVIKVSKNSNTITELNQTEAIEYLDAQGRIIEEGARQRLLEEEARRATEDAASAAVNIDSDIERLDAQQTKGFEEYTFDEDDRQDDSQDDDTVSGPATVPSPPVPSEPLADPNKLNGPVSQLGSNSNSMSLNEVMVHPTYGATFDEILTEKEEKGEWTNIPDSYDELEEYLRKKGIETMNIPDIEEWLDMIRNCKH